MGQDAGRQDYAQESIPLYGEERLHLRDMHDNKVTCIRIEIKPIAPEATRPDDRENAMYVHATKRREEKYG